MARDWEAQFAAWSRPPTEDETRKMERAEARIREAIADDAKLQSHEVRVFRQGSYYNRTNVPKESDVDIRVEIRDVQFSDFSFVDEHASDPEVRKRLRAATGLTPASYNYAEFKSDVGVALVRKFGPPPAVKRGDKAYDIHETRYQVESDCLAAMRHVRYRRDAFGKIVAGSEGIEFVSDKARHYRNFPEQQYAHGVAKHRATGQRFKKMVRVLKNLRNEMEDEGQAIARPIVSFLTECLVYNVPDQIFARETHYERTRDVIRWLYLNSKTDDQVSTWREESELKWLFRPSQRITRQQANEFVLAAWHYVGFKNK